MALYQQHLEGCFNSKKPDAPRFEALAEKAQKVIEYYRDKTLPLFTLPSTQDGLDEIHRIAADIRAGFKHLVVLGTGGSTLNGQALIGLQYCANQLGSLGIRIHFMDNIDPYQVECLLSAIPLKETAFLAISKSGRTLETLTQTLICIEALRPFAPKTLGRHFYIISEPTDNPLRQLGKTLGATLLEHDAAIGGRFSTFTNVGLLPAAVLGLDSKRLREGAAEIIDHAFTTPLSDPVLGAALNLAWMQQGIRSTVIMAYCDRLAGFATWYRQIWAESLGKNGGGSTPIKAMGTLDQHSQLQLYLDGPKDKGFTLIALKTKGQGYRLNTSAFPGMGFDYLNGLAIGDVLEAEHQATHDTLIKNACPVRRITLPYLDETMLGALIMHSILETVITADMLGVNPFDQPAVEDGKTLARSLLEKQGVAA